MYFLCRIIVVYLCKKLCGRYVLWVWEEFFYPSRRYTYFRYGKKKKTRKMSSEIFVEKFRTISLCVFIPSFPLFVFCLSVKKLSWKKKKMLTWVSSFSFVHCGILFVMCIFVRVQNAQIKFSLCGSDIFYINMCNKIYYSVHVNESMWKFSN